MEADRGNLGFMWSPRRPRVRQLPCYPSLGFSFIEFPWLIRGLINLTLVVSNIDTKKVALGKGDSTYECMASYFTIAIQNAAMENQHGSYEGLLRARVLIRGHQDLSKLADG